ncbi:MAG: ABC transporter ATP-binding protein [Clostridiales bacterium]|nr:ABC transporter ATP-binding protein [Clostridiales bacterium]
MKKLLFYMKDYIKESIFGPLFKLIETIFELSVPLVVAAIIDRGIGHGDKGYITKMSLVLVALGAAGLLFSVTAQYFAAKASAGFAKKLRHALFVHLQKLSFSEIDTLGASTMITRLTSDTNQVQVGVNLTLRLLLRAPFVVFGAMVMAFAIDFKAALVFAATIPLLFVVVFVVMFWSIPLYRKVQARLDRVLGITRENLSGVRVIRAFCKEEDEVAEFLRENNELSRMQKYVGRISALLNPATYVVINLSIIWLIWTGALRVEAGIITQGAVVALYNYVTQILVELIKFANLIITITKSIASAKRIEQVFEIESSLKEGQSLPERVSSPGTVEFRGVSLRYKNARENSLSDINFKAEPGQTIGIIGGTGSGKSSLVNMIPRFYDAAEGEVLVDNINVRDYQLEALRQKIGIVPQKAVLFAGTARDNILLGKEDATDDEIWEALTIAKADDVVKEKGGLDFYIEQGGKNLSGGQRQRLTIARALVRKPDILILDDSASALDFATDAALRRAIRKLRPIPTVFIVSQRTSSVQHADQIIVLDNGRIVGIGKRDELLRHCEVYREIHESQFQKEGA